MARRGPYKQYELDTSIAIQKTTLSDRRKQGRRDLDEDNRNGNEFNLYEDLIYEDLYEDLDIALDLDIAIDLDIGLGIAL